MQDLVFLFDVDNTLLDNDVVQSDFEDHLEKACGAGSWERYWTFIEELRDQVGYTDYIGALERLRAERLHEPAILEVGNWMIDYPFAERLYPGAEDAVRYAASLGSVVILSDGDAVFQPRKVVRSGLWALFGGHVLIYPHKEKQLAAIAKRYPAKRYVLIDDKLRILAAVKKEWRERVTTIFPRQGHYAEDPALLRAYPKADLSVARISALSDLDVRQLQPTSEEGAL